MKWWYVDPKYYDGYADNAELLDEWYVKDNGINMMDVGINNLAFDLPYAIVNMCKAVACGKRILGGDILVKNRDGHWTEQGCDNWYSNKKDPEETLKDAIEYLTWYYNKFRNSEWKVSIVVDPKS